MKRLTRQWRDEAARLLRLAYAEEFEEIISGLAASASPEHTGKRGRPRSTVHSKAMAEFERRHWEERDNLALRLRCEAGIPNVSLVKAPKPLIRDDMNALDAWILHRRGMTIPEMAKYDGCTQVAAVRALLPQLLGRPKPRAWYEGYEAISPIGLAEVMGCDSRLVRRVLVA